MNKPPLLGLLVLSGLFYLAGSVHADSPTVSPPLLSGVWPAQWIACPDCDSRGYGVFYFRRSFQVSGKPDKFIVHLSADNRYRLYVNGVEAGEGPGRGDPEHWRFESLDLAPWLQPGRNVLAAVVWNFGEDLPMAQMTRRTGFLLQGDSDLESAVNTGAGEWKVLHDTSYSPLLQFWDSSHRARRVENDFTVVGPGDRIQGTAYPWGWRGQDYDDSAWLRPEPVGRRATPRGIRDGGSHWNLVPRPIPPMEKKPEAPARIRRTEGVAADEGFLTGGKALSLPPHADATILLDQGYLTNVYPELTVSGGKGATIRLVWAEALWDSAGNKENRDRFDGMHIFGHYDEFMPDGGENRTFTTLWFRTFRYLELEITTGDHPLVLHSLKNTFTGYPFKLNAGFESDDSSLAKIWQVSWRTARLCAGENYFDCPYYEQLQYVGDTRIQALISLYLSGDDRLMRQAITHFDDSRMPDGLTQSRYPTFISQVIPPYSLFWVVMVHDYWMHRRDDAFVQSFLPGIQGVLGWFEHRLDPAGLPGSLEWWNFVDWAPEYGDGVPPGAEAGGSAVIGLQYAYALRCASDLARAFGDEAGAQHYTQVAERVGRAVMDRCWSKERQMLAETPDKKQFSQHTNAMAILLDLLPAAESRALFERIASEKDMIACTFYYRFYLLEALRKVGLADRYVPMLGPWRDMLAMGLTTFAENPEPTRSDCHAWSASPAWGLLATVCGIRPASPGFRSVRISPALGPLNRVSASMPHPDGEISLKMERKTRGGLSARVTLPPGLAGSFVWGGVEYGLSPGENRIEAPSGK